VKLWLDDIRPAPEGWLWCKTADQLRRELIRHRWDLQVVSFDHDLGENEETGYDVLKQLERAAANNAWLLIPDRMEIHSANPVGRKNMQAAIDSIERMRNVRK
jgi:hypothetical protein